MQQAFDAFDRGDVNTINAIFTPDGPSHAASGKTGLQGGPFTDLKDACAMCAHLSP